MAQVIIKKRLVTREVEEKMVQLELTSLQAYVVLLVTGSTRCEDDTLRQAIIDVYKQIQGLFREPFKTERLHNSSPYYYNNTYEGDLELLAHPLPDFNEVLNDC